MAAFTSKAPGDVAATGQTTWNEVGAPTVGDTVSATHNLTSANDWAVGNSPAAGTAVLTLTGCSLTMAAGKRLTLAGDAALVNGQIIFGDTANGGAHLRFDGSTSAAKYRVKATNTGQTTNKVTFNGTAANHSIIDTVATTPAGCGIGVHTSTSTVIFAFRATYADFTGLGSSTEGSLTDAIGAGINSAGLEAYFENCTFTSCGRRFVQECTATSDVVIRHCDSTGDLPTHPWWVVSSAVPTTGQRVFTDNTVTVGKQGLVIQGKNGFTFERNVTDLVNCFGISGSGANFASWADIILYARTDSSVSFCGYPGDTLNRTYHFIDFPSISVCGFTFPSGSVGTPSGTITFSQHVYDVVTADMGTDGFDMPPTIASGSWNYVHSYALELPGTAGNQATNITAAHGNKFSTSTIDHCTVMTSDTPGRAPVVVGNNYMSQPGQVAAFKNSIVWAPSLPAGLGYACEKLTTGQSSFTFYTGTVATATANTITKTGGNNFPTTANAALADSQAIVVITAQRSGGPPVGEVRSISANTANQITVSSNFSATPDTGTDFAIHTVDALTPSGVLKNTFFNVNNGTIYDGTGNNARSVQGFQGWWSTASTTLGSDTTNLGSGTYTGSNGPKFADITRNMATFYTAALGNSAPAWADATSYSVGDIRSAQTSTFYGNAVICFRCITAHTSNAANATNGKPGSAVATSYRTNWEFASIYAIREAIKAGTTKTDASLGLTNANYIRYLHAWVRAGFAPKQAILRNFGPPGSTVGSVDFVPLPLSRRTFYRRGLARGA